jgi:membrane protein DedA with SNARE-associated domain
VVALVSEWLASLLADLSASPVYQGVLAALATFILEDPTTIGCGLLVAEQRMAFMTAMLGVSIGIAVGDMGLYGIGRGLGPQVTRWGLLSEPKLRRGEQWFRRNMISAVILSRFVPGMRLPTYVAAGLLKAPWWRFTVVVVGASLVWTFLLLKLTVAVGERVLPLLGSYRWPAALVALLLLVLMQQRTARRWSTEPDHGPATVQDRRDRRETRPTSWFELWPPWLFYIPVLLYWLWLSLRHRGLLLPTAANPSIYSGGFIGESKSEILDLVPDSHRSWVAPYVTITRDQGPAGTIVARAEEGLAAAGLSFPVVAKPDVGQRGAGVRPLAGSDELAAYVESFPAGHRFLLQEMVPAEVAGDKQDPDQLREAGVLYWRMPGAETGTLFSITLKLFPLVTGDGIHTVRELIEADARARLLRGIYFKRHQQQLEQVLASGEQLPLVFAGNHCQGTIFKDGTALATRELAERIHAIARAIPGFYFGRFDIRFADQDAFWRGEDFKIIEINGASAEATHIWDASARLGEAYQTLFAQLSAVFAIGAANRRRGRRPLPLHRFIRDLLAYRRTVRSYPLTR